MHAPGVEVRPLRITGESEFNEIFFTDVQVPIENLLGDVGGGWQVAMTTLLHERGTLARSAGDPRCRSASSSLARDRGADQLQATGSPASGSRCRPCASRTTVPRHS
jgi:alkylation response protein AidB-like acyl-CoA dehydrogenase